MDPEQALDQALAAGAAGSASVSPAALQAGELAVHLSAWQTELDRRSERLHMQLAALDQQARQDRQAAAVREDALDQRAAEVLAREAALEAAVKADERERSAAWQAVDEARAACALQAEQLAAAEGRLARVEQLQRETAERLQHARLQGERDRLQHEQRVAMERGAHEAQVRQALAVIERRRDALDDSETALDQRRAACEAAEAALTQSQEELAEQQRALDLARLDIANIRQAAQENLAQREAEMAADASRRQGVFERRAARLRRRASALASLAREVAARERASLADRLAAAESLAEAQAPSPEAAARLAVLRQHLTAAYEAALTEAQQTARGAEIRVAAAATDVRRLRREQTAAYVLKREQLERLTRELAELSGRFESADFRHHEARRAWDAERHAREARLRSLELQSGWSEPLTHRRAA